MYTHLIGQLEQGNVGKGQVSRSKDWKQLLSQKKAAKRTGVAAVPRIPRGRSDNMKRRQATSTQTGEIVSRVDGQNMHLFEQDKSVEGQDKTQESNRSVPEVMDLLTRGSQPV